ncbi:MAG: YqgE/AlgH family protein [Bacteroidota bacterium]
MKNLDFNIFHPGKTSLKPAGGRVLIAEPFLQGPYFGRSIILLTEHNDKGTVGLVLNKSTELYPDEVIDDLLSFEGELFVGGPVSSNTLNFLHTLGPLVPGSVRVTETVYWGGDFEHLKRMINEGEASSNSVKFFAGYSGWAPGQLDSELAENSWVVSTLSDETIMTREVDDVWEKAMAEMGDIYKTWTNFPRNPAFN